MGYVYPGGYHLFVNDLKDQSTPTLCRSFFVAVHNASDTKWSPEMPALVRQACVRCPASLDGFRDSLVPRPTDRESNSV